MEDEKFSFRKRLASFKYAIKGLQFVLKNEHNARIHLVATTVAILIAWYLKIALIEWVTLTIVIGLVWVCEIINSCIEYCCNLISATFHPSIKIIKDLAAAAVLIAAIVAFIIGCIIFLPKIYFIFF